jgi:hypothetical protein
MPLKDQALTVCYVAWNTSTNAGQTGDATNHTLKLIQDGTEGSPTNSPAQVDSTNAPGVYSLALTAADMNYNCVVLCGKSSTANVVVIPLVITTERGVLPTVAPTNAGGFITLGTGSGQLNVDGAGNADANVLRWNATAVATPATAGIPDINVKNYNNQTAATDGNNLPKVDVVDIAGAAVNAAAAQLGVNVVNIAGTASAGAAGYTAPDWGHVNAPTTTVALSGTTISTGQAVASVSGAVASVTGNVGGSVGSVTGAVGSVTGSVGSVVGNVGGNVLGNVVGTVGFIVNAPFKINTSNGFSVFMVQSSDNKSPFTSGGVTATRSIAGASPVAVSGTVSQVGSTNEYYFSGAAADFNGTTVSFLFSAAGANNVGVTINTQP